MVGLLSQLVLASMVEEKYIGIWLVKQSAHHVTDRSCSYTNRQYFILHISNILSPVSIPLFHPFHIVSVIVFKDTRSRIFLICLTSSYDIGYKQNIPFLCTIAAPIITLTKYTY